VLGLETSQNKNPCRHRLDLSQNAVNLEKTAGEQTDHEGIRQEKLGAGKINVEELIRRQ
jgi:hypothetical protein